MGQNWALAFVAASVTALVTTPLLRRVAIRTGTVDTPRSHKSHARTVPYLGGVGLVLGAAVGTFAGPLSGGRAGLLIGGAALLCAVGAVDDRVGLGAGVRLVAQCAVAIAAYGMGIHAVATGVPALDAVVTVVWIVGIANALNLLDNMDGLAGGNGLVVASGVFVIAALGGQTRVATIAVALAGACLGFLAFNVRPAAIFMGDAGSLPLGFLLSTLTLQVDPALAPPASFVVPLLLLAVPLLDTATVVLGRLRHDVSPFQGGTDHLSHRLVHKGRSRERAVILLVGAQAAFAAVAVLVGRRVMPLSVGVGLGLVLLAVLMRTAVRGRMYRNRRRPVPFRAKLVAGGGAAFLAALSAPAVFALLMARAPLQAGARFASSGLAAAQLGDAKSARPEFEQSSAAFAVAEERLHAPIVSLGLAMPGLSSNLRASRTLASTGKRLADTGQSLAGEADPNRLKVTGGTIDVAEVARLAPLLAHASVTLDRSLADVRSVDQPYLAPQIEKAVADFERRLTSASSDARRAAAAADVAPAILGSGRPRRYFLAVQNNAESRATGGFIGNFGELVSDGGRVRLERFGRIGELNGKPTDQRVLRAPQEFLARYQRFDLEHTWQNVNLSPDLDAVTRVIADLYPQSGGQPIDGVVAVDPAGLAAILKLTGPVTVAPWPEPITADNVVDVTLRDAYARLPDQEQRVKFIGDVAHKVVDTATSADLGTPPTIALVLGDAARGGHLRVSLLNRNEAKVMETIGADGGVPPLMGDSLLLTTQNAGANKIDYYLRRSVRYDVELQPLGDGSTAELTGKVSIKLDNQAPASGLPAAVIGPYDARFKAGENRTFLSLYTPLHLEGARLEGEAVAVETAVELGRQVYSTYVSIPATSARTITFDVKGTVPLGADGRYNLDLLRQPLLHPDGIDVRVKAAPGWRLSPGDGLSGNGRLTSAMFDLKTERKLHVGVVPANSRALWERLISPDTTAAQLAR